MVQNIESKIESYKSMSHGEKRIAHSLDMYGIPFEYEKPTLVIDRGKQRIWYPDFTLHPYSIILEYFGVTNNPDYSQGIRHRLETYKTNHVDVIPLYPETLKPGWENYVFQQIDERLEERYDNFRKTCFAHYREPKNDFNSSKRPDYQAHRSY